MFVNLDLTQHTHISWYELISMLLSTDELRYQHKFRFNPDEKSIFIDWSGRPNDTTISDESCGLWLFVILCMWEPWPTPSPTSCLFHRPHSVVFFVRSQNSQNYAQFTTIIFCMLLLCIRGSNWADDMFVNWCITSVWMHRGGLVCDHEPATNVQ